MGDLIAVCPECGHRAKVDGNCATMLDGTAKCKHRQSPLNCPAFDPLIFHLLVLTTPTFDRP